MNNFMVLTESINFIEANLCEPITREDIAAHCYVSLSQLEKLFRYALHISIKDYISRRRMTQAAKDIKADAGTVTELAMKYQFNSVEVFSRCFKRVWNVLPSEFNEHRKFADLFPRIDYSKSEGETTMAKKIDYSEVYDYLRSMKGSYVLCFDMVYLSKLNEISRKLGDMAILEQVARIEEATTDDMLMFRVGGDEFVLVTGLTDIAKVEEIRQSILAKNGNPVVFEGKEYPISLYCGITQIPDHLRYSEFYSEVYGAIMQDRKRMQEEQQ